MLYKILKEDFKRYNRNPNILYIIKSYFSNKGKQAVILYRLSNYFYNKNLKFIAVLIKNHNLKTTGCEIGEQCQIGKGLKIGHPNGIVISGRAKIGHDLNIMQQVTIGGAWGTNKNDCIIGNNVFIGAGAKILGSTIGNNVTIGANAVVLIDIPNDSTAVGIPAKLLSKNTMVNS